jgi:hypothetical protein
MHLDQVAERVVVARASPSDQIRRVHLHPSPHFFFPQAAFSLLTDIDNRQAPELGGIRAPNS